MAGDRSERNDALQRSRSSSESIRPASARSADRIQPEALGTAGVSKWRKMWTRSVWGLVMLTLFAFIVATGPLAALLLVVGVQTAVFREVISIAHLRHKERMLPWFRTQMWGFLLATYYYLYGELAITHFKRAVFVDAFLAPLAAHHRLISFCLYMAVLIGFVLNLKRGHYRFQFNQFGIAHMTLLLVVVQAQFVIHNVIAGLFWFVLPVLLVAWNDMAAYFFGFFFGRTPLIKISPRKTWEGFLGAFVSTLIFGYVASGVLGQVPLLTCPADLDAVSQPLSTQLALGAQRLFALFSTSASPPAVHCEQSALFEPEIYKLPVVVYALARLVVHSVLGARYDVPRTVSVRPVQLHALVISAFVSLVAPFGGFFASGFKRAFKVKDFADSIPGHGGITDRMDCQFLAGFFTYLYSASFVRIAPLTASILLQRAVSELSSDELRELHASLGAYLYAHDLL